jgi:hypothetical protein
MATLYCKRIAIRKFPVVSCWFSGGDAKAVVGFQFSVVSREQRQPDNQQLTTENRCALAKIA